MTLIEKFKHSFFHFVYPKTCLHCHLIIHPNEKYFCESCLQNLEMLDPTEHCATCFNFLDSSQCPSCHHGDGLFAGMAACFDYAGPAASLIKKFKYADQEELAKGIAAYMAGQFVRLEWPLPDFIIFIPIAFSHWVERGYNQSELIAKHMSDFLKIPCLNALSRDSGDYSQAGLSFSQRNKLTSNAFKLRKNCALEDSTILLVDDVMTTGSTFKRCAEVLAGGFPSKLYALAFCRAFR